MRPTPPEPNIKIIASRRDARNRDTISLASLRDAVFIYDYIRWCRSQSLVVALPARQGGRPVMATTSGHRLRRCHLRAVALRQPPAKFWQASGLLHRNRQKV
jgi:hypothetical protein